MTVPAVESQTGRDHGSTECDIYLEYEEDDGAERMVGRPERIVQPFLAEDEQVGIRWREKEKEGRGRRERKDTGVVEEPGGDRARRCGGSNRHCGCRV